MSCHSNPFSCANKYKLVLSKVSMSSISSIFLHCTRDFNIVDPKWNECFSPQGFFWRPRRTCIWMMRASEHTTMYVTALHLTISEEIFHTLFIGLGTLGKPRNRYDGDFIQPFFIHASIHMHLEPLIIHAFIHSIDHAYIHGF